MDGIFNLCKPVGMTSHDVVARVRRLTHQKRVGHAGTLDPAASGVLPVCLGLATRVVEYLSEGGKSYRATIVFGVVTNTYDAEGEVVRSASVHLSREAIEAALPAFLGDQMQVPPLYSAIKKDGQPLYKLARAGIEVELQPRPVVISRLEVLEWQPPALTLEVECSKGTYIRSLAYDLGERLGCGAHLGGLVRLRSGPFTLEESLTLEELAQALDDGSWVEYLFAPDEALLQCGAVIVGPGNEQRILQGQGLRLASGAVLPALPVMATAMSAPPVIAPVAASDGDAEEQKRAGGGLQEREEERTSDLLRAYSVDGRFLAILSWQRDSATWHPQKVFHLVPVGEAEH
ncbi:MAG TPA: tRNA pseudouridine(55) synthase TruB [Ktedonobacterales bacterium]|jgi:tRNA pseudouridine55 synthase